MATLDDSTDTAEPVGMCPCLEVSEMTQVTAALEAATMRRSSGISGLPCRGTSQHVRDPASECVLFSHRQPKEHIRLPVTCQWCQLTWRKTKRVP